jgi:hypothetical protein
MIFTLCKHPHFLLLFCSCSYTKQSLDLFHPHPLINVNVERVIKYVLQDMVQDHCFSALHIFSWNSFSHKNKKTKKKLKQEAYPDSMK